MTIPAEHVTRVKRVVSPLVRKIKGASYKCPMPVWDSTGEMIGVAIDVPVTMGGKECNAQATFVLHMRDTEDQIQVKAQDAINAIHSRVLVSIRPVKKKAEPAA